MKLANSFECEFKFAALDAFKRGIRSPQNRLTEGKYSLTVHVVRS